MTFDDAVDYVLSTKKVAFAYKCVNNRHGSLYVLEYDEDVIDDEDYEKESDKVSILYSGGIIYSSVGEEDFYSVDDVPSDAKSMEYRETGFDSFRYMDYQIQVTLKILNGCTEDKALEDYPCKECDAILFKTGYFTKCDACK